MNAQSAPAVRYRIRAPSLQGMAWFGRLLGMALDSALWLLLALMLLLLGGALGTPWYRIVALEGASMAPTLRFGDALLVTPPPATLEPGMIVVIQSGSELVTHRLIAMMPDGQLVTRGDANRSVDSWAAPVAVVGICRLRIPYLGGLINSGHEALVALVQAIWARL